METARVAKPLSGDKLYQQRARQALPLLVRQAVAASPIYYSDLATELAMPNPRNLNYVLGSVGRAIESLSNAWKEEIPPVQCLVINKNTHLPGNGIGWFVSKKDEFRKLSRKQQRLIVEAELQKIFAYTKWHQVLSAFGLTPAPDSAAPLIYSASHYGGSGEGADHKRLKAFIAKNPHLVGMSSSSKVTIESALPSGDSIDVFFEDSDDDWMAVEVKPSSSPVPDITRGLFQCVKYQAVMEAVQATKGMPQNATAVLVLGGALPSELVAIKNTLGVSVFEKIVPK